MSETVFKDCEFRYIEDDGAVCCKNKEGLDRACDNCTGNIHLNCDHYNPRKDMCLKWFETGVSETYQECKEKSVYNDTKLQQKWSN